MREELINFINEIKSAKGLSAFDEATTKQIIIIRILNLLGWSIFDINDIKPEYPVDPQNTNEKVDYALAQNSDNMVFVEAKAVNVDLENWEEKFCYYCYKNNVALGVLTNGLSWWFYLPREKGSWYERKFFSINLTQQDVETIATKFIDFLSKETVLSGKSIEYAKKTYELKQKKQIIKKTLPEAWNTLINSEDETLIDVFNSYVEKISGFRADPQDLANFLAKIKPQLIISEEPTISVSKRRVKGVLPSEKISKPTAYVRTGYTGKSIKSFTLNNKRYEVNSWKSLLMTVCTQVYELNKKDFTKVLSLKGRKRPYFTLDANELRVPEKIRGTNIFVETNLSANSIVSLCEDVLSLFGYKNSLQIETD
jgi:hypothetical protein